MNKMLAMLAALTVLPAYAADAPPATPTQAAPAAPTPPSSAGVARAQFTSAVQDREPTDTLTTLTTDKTRIYYFTEIRDAANQKITHRWEYHGKVMAEMHFDVGADRWRVFSSKTLDPDWTGEWKVSVVDEHGGTLGASTFTYAAASTPAPTPTPASR